MESTGRKQEMRITPTSGLSPDEIERLIGDAAESVDSDRRLKDIIASRNKLDSLLRNTQRTYAEFGNSLTEIDRANGKRVFAESEEALHSESQEDVQRALKAVEFLANQLTFAMLNMGSVPQHKQVEEMAR